MSGKRLTAASVQNALVSDRKTSAKRSRGRPPGGADVESELLTVACREFLKHGYGATSMAAIVKAAGVSKSTLYSYFPTKAELFSALLNRTYLQARPPARLHNERDLELGEALVEYGNNALDISLSDWWSGLDRMIYAEGTRFPELGVAAHERIWLGIEVLSMFIAECAVRDGVPCRDPTGVAQGFMLALRGYRTDVNLSGEPADPDARLAFVKRIVEVMMRGRASW